MTISVAKLVELLKSEEGQYSDRKSLFHGAPGAKHPRDRREIRDEVAEYVAAFANAEGGVVVFGVENDGTVTGHGYPADAVDEALRVPGQRLRPALRLFAAMTTEEAELTATLYAAWDAALADGLPSAPNDLKRAVLGWHADKKRFEPLIFDRIDWLRAHGLVPHGSAVPLSAKRSEEQAELFP